MVNNKNLFDYRYKKGCFRDSQKQPFYLCKETVKTDGEILVVATCGRRSNV